MVFAEKRGVGFRMRDEAGSDRRELCNDQVLRCDTRIAQLPANLKAGLMGWMPRPFFSTPGDERERPSVELERS